MNNSGGVARASVKRAVLDDGFWGKLEQFVTSTWQLILEYQLLILLIVISLVVLYLIIIFFKRRERQVQKLWNFLLFFLSKRQMLIPLVITLSKRDDILNLTTQEFLIEIRKKCRENPLEKNPKERLELEVEISKQLFYYFSELEKKELYQNNRKLKKVVSDLEFIDEKLVQLQYLYNKEASRWNTIVYIAYPFFKLFGFKTFKKFELPNN
jgi:hypothetical protein